MNDFRCARSKSQKQKTHIIQVEWSVGCAELHFQPADLLSAAWQTLNCMLRSRQSINFNKCIKWFLGFSHFAPTAVLISDGRHLQWFEQDSVPSRVFSGLISYLQLKTFETDCYIAEVCWSVQCQAVARTRYYKMRTWTDLSNGWRDFCLAVRISCHNLHMTSANQYPSTTPRKARNPCTTRRPQFEHPECQHVHQKGRKGQVMSYTTLPISAILINKWRKNK